MRLEVVGRIEHTDRERSARLASWISSMRDLHRSKPPAAVSYSRPMPDLEGLMQVILVVATSGQLGWDCLLIETNHQAMMPLTLLACDDAGGANNARDMRPSKCRVVHGGQQLHHTQYSSCRPAFRACSNTFKARTCCVAAVAHRASLLAKAACCGAVTNRMKC